MRPLKKIVLLVLSIFIGIVLLGISVYASAIYLNRQMQNHLVKEINRLSRDLKVVSPKKLRSAKYTSKITETPKDMSFLENKEQEECMRKHMKSFQHLTLKNELSCNKKNKLNLVKEEDNDAFENAAKELNGVYKKNISSENKIDENERDLIDRKYNMLKNASAVDTTSNVEQTNNDHKMKNTDNTQNSIKNNKKSITPVKNDVPNEEQNKTLYAYETYINGKKIPNLNETKNIEFKKLELTVMPNEKCPGHAKAKNEESNYHIGISSEEKNIFDKVSKEFRYFIKAAEKHTNSLHFRYNIKYAQIEDNLDCVKCQVKSNITYERLYALLIYIKNYIDCFYNSFAMINRDELCVLKQIPLKQAEDIIKSNKAKNSYNNQSENSKNLVKTAELPTNFRNIDKTSINENYTQRNEHLGLFKNIRIIINNDKNNCVEIDYIEINLLDVDRVCKIYKQKNNDVQSSIQKKPSVSIIAKPLLNDTVNKLGTATEIPKNLKIRRQSV